MGIKAVLFDFDGTLADTLPLSFTAFQYVFQKYEQREVSQEEIIAMFGPTEDGIIAKNFSNQANVSAAIQDYYRIYEQGHLENKITAKEILELLDLLHSKGIRMGVITGKSRNAYDISVNSLGMAHYFDVVITGDDVQKPKPDPEGIRTALSMLEVPKEDAIFVGDSNADIQAGKSAGVRTVGVQWLSTYQSTHFEAEPDMIFTKVQEFIVFLSQIS
ncbi:HAD family hydrolase [Brevibacillus sp. SYSU BS000544]|uniref:HAD family hydrolase n=1 Tax=Brevibacillus sp. SYSU BS000544 TaxID=3416443 RepID=UPI003CE5A540